MEFSSIENASKQALSSINKGDVVAVHSQSSSVDFDMDVIKSAEDTNRFAIGLRVFEGGRIGNSYVNSLEDIPFLVQSGRDSARFGDEIDFELPPEADYPELPLYFQEVADYPKEEFVRLGGDVLKSLKSIDGRAKVSVSVAKSRSWHYLANTSGFTGSYPETQMHLSANMLLVDDEESLLSVGESDSVYDTKLDLDTILKSIEWRYKNAQKKVSVKTGYFPILFAPSALDIILEPVEIAANGKTLYKGISVLGDKLGQKIASDKLSITDDPFYPGAAGSYPYDDEGVVPSKLPLLENGIFRNFITDLSTAKRLGKSSTGHGSRSVTSLPAPSFSNLIFSTGDAALDDMIGSIDYGLIVFEFLGGGMSNVLAGDFSVNVELGYLIENGKIKGRVKDCMISGNAFEVLKSIRTMENKLHKEGSLYAPHILFDRISVTG